ncbi:hypothetical protein ACC709_36755, partial [Rhizobium ruizarguesonis]
IGAFGLPNTEILEGEQYGLIKDFRARPISIFIFCDIGVGPTSSRFWNGHRQNWSATGKTNAN